MINVILYEENNNIIGYEVKGHTEDKRICAVVSVITQSPILTILDKFELNNKKFEYIFKDGYSKVKLPFNNSIIEVIMKHMKITLLAIELQYPSEIKIEVINI